MRRTHIFTILLATAATVAVSAAAIGPAAASAAPRCQRQGNTYVCPFDYTGGISSETFWGGEKGVVLTVEAWGAEGGGTEDLGAKDRGGHWEWPGGRGGYATNTFRVPPMTYSTIYVAPGRAGWWVQYLKYPKPAGGGASTIVTSAWPPKGLADVIAIAGGGGGGGGDASGGDGGVSGAGKNGYATAFGEDNGGKGGGGGSGGAGGRLPGPWPGTGNSGGSGLGGPGGRCSVNLARCEGAWAPDLGGYGAQSSRNSNGDQAGAGGGGWGGGGSGSTGGYFSSGGGGGSYPASGAHGSVRYGNGFARITFSSPYAKVSPALVRAQCTVHGTDGPDVLVGGSGDVVCGGGGDDHISTDGHENLVYGGDGNDTVVLGGDGDVAYAGPGDDLLNGSTGADTLVGDSGHDHLSGGGGADTCLDPDPDTDLGSCEYDRKGEHSGHR